MESRRTGPAFSTWGLSPVRGLSISWISKTGTHSAQSCVRRNKESCTLRNFFKIVQGLDPWPLLHALQTQPELWNQYTVRTHHPRSAHRVVDDIILRYSRFDSGDDFVDKVCTSIESVDYPAWKALPQAHQFVYGMMGKTLGLHLGRVMISRVAPGISIPPHSDRIAEAEAIFPDRVPPAIYYDRYHVVLQSQPGVQFTCGDETVYMAPGEAWWFDNQQIHSVVNNSAEDRIHLIMDIRVRHDDYVPS